MASYAAKTIVATSTDLDFRLSVASGLFGCNFSSSNTHILLESLSD